MTIIASTFDAHEDFNWSTGEASGKWFAQIETTRGERFIHMHAFDNVDAALEFAAKVVRSGRSLNLDHWVEGHPAYGSDAFLAEEDDAWEYGIMLSRGLINEADVPAHLATLL